MQHLIVKNMCLQQINIKYVTQIFKVKHHTVSQS